MKVIIILSMVILAVSAQEFCGMCQMVVTQVENMVNNHEPDIQKLADKLCSFLPNDYQGMCTSMINMYLPDIIKKVESQLTPKVICSDMGLCHNMLAHSTRVVKNQPPLAAKNVKGTPYCSICEMIIQQIDNLVQSEGPKIENLVERVCSFVPSDYQAMCKMLIEQYFPTILQKLEQAMDPHTICTDLHVCSMLSNEAQVLKNQPVASKGKDTPYCSACEMIVQYIQNLVNQGEPNIEQLVEKFCQYLPKSLQGMCANLVSQYLPAIIQDLENALPPQTICADIKFCSNMLAHAALAAQNEQQLDGIDWNAIGCDFCTVIFQFLQQQLFSNAMQQAFTNDLNKVCQILPNQEYAAKCSNILQQYGNQLFKYAEGLLAPSHVCPMVSGGKCSSN